jgi:FO synthase
MQDWGFDFVRLPMAGAGLDDFGGISPVTPDFINPRHPWPHLETLEARCAALGFRLRPRLPIYDRFVAREGYLDASLRPCVEAAADRLRSVATVAGLAETAIARSALLTEGARA